MTPGIIALAASACTATAMLVAGWHLPAVAITGPRPAIRIAQLVPQFEVTALLIVGALVWTRLLAAERRAPLRVGLAATARGRMLAVYRALGTQVMRVMLATAAGAVVWLVATLAGGIPLADVLSTRVLLLAFAAFGLGLGAWASAVTRSGVTAIGVALAVLVVMAAAPFVLTPVIATFGARPALVGATVLLNPWIIAAGVARLDLVHMQWIYALSPLGSLDVTLPGLTTAVAIYGGAGALLAIAAVAALRPVNPEMEA
jgi:hypothetical protein